MWCWMAAAALAAPLDVATTELPNGLRVAVIEQHRTDQVALHVRYGVGARDESAGEKGLAHLFEHLMFEASAHVPDGAFDRWLSEAGGDNNAWTSEDETAYHLQVPSGGLERALFLESDRMGWLQEALTAESLANQQSVVLQERAEAFEAPRGREDDALVRVLYPPGHPYRVGAIGTVADVQGATLAQARAFHARWYRPDNAVLVLVGHVQAEQALERVAHWFTDVVAREGPTSTPPPLPSPSPQQGWIADDVDERTLILAWPTVPRTHPDAPALEVLSWVLSAGPGTRIDERLYYRRSLVTESSAAHWALDWAGLFRVTVSSFRLPLAGLRSQVEQALAELQRRPVTEAELARALAVLEDGHLATLEDPAALAALVADCWTLEGEPDCFDARWARLAAVTVDDVQRVAARWLTPERASSLSVVPHGDMGALPGAEPVVLP